MGITLRELADRLGLSKTTVSRALNGYADVGDVTRERVRLAAEALGYTPNASAQRLISGRAQMVGMVLPLPTGHFGDPFLLELLIGLGDGLKHIGLDLIVTAAPPGREELLAYRRLVGGRRVDGVVVSRTRVEDERIHYLVENGFPFVAHGRVPGPMAFDSLEVDNRAGARLAAEALIDAGHVELAMINAPRSLNFAVERQAGFEAELARRGLAMGRIVEAADASEEEGQRMMAALLRDRPEVTGVFCANDRLAIGALSAARAAGRTAGVDLGLVGYDDLPAAAFTDPPLSTIGQSTREAGARLSTMLVERLAAPDRPVVAELWQPVAILRRSHLCQRGAT